MAARGAPGRSHRGFGRLEASLAVGDRVSLYLRHHVEFALTPLVSCRERTERSSISTRHEKASSVAGSQGRGGGNHTRNSSLSSLPSLPPASPRAGRPLSTFSVSSSAGRQLADGSYQVGGAAASAPSSPSKRKPASSIIETAARMFEGYEGSAIKQRFDEGTEELKRYAQREREVLGTGGTSNGLATARVVPVESGSEAGSSTAAQPRAASPSRRSLSPELARRAAAFEGGEVNSTSPAQVFGGAGRGGETAEQREERKRKARKEDREKRYIERMERESVRKLENMGMVVTPSEESVPLEPLVECEGYQSRAPTVWDLYRPVKPGDPPRPPPVLWEVSHDVSAGPSCIADLLLRRRARCLSLRPRSPLPPRSPTPPPGRRTTWCLPPIPSRFARPTPRVLLRLASSSTSPRSVASMMDSRLRMASNLSRSS